MAKSKSSKKGAKSAEPSPALNGVKAGRVTKPAEDSKKKSKDTAKATAKAVQKQLEKKEKKKKRKAPSPSPSSDEESAATSDSSASSASEDDGNSDVSVDKASAKPTTKAGKVTKPESSDDDSDSDASDSDADAGAPKANGSAKNAAAKDDSSDDSEASDDSDDSEADAKPAKANGVNGTKTTGAKDESSDGSEDESDDSADGETKKVDKDSDDGSEDDSESDASEIDSVAGDSKPATKGPEQKKRKADSDSGPAVKRTKHNGEPLSEPSKNLFVGSLSWNVDEDWLYREFESFSPVAVRVITRPEDGKSKGFGYVEFNTVEEATAALDAKQGAEVDGRNLNIDFGKVRPDRSYSNDQVNNRAQKFGDRAPNEPSATLFVGNVSFGADQNMLSEAFSEYGTVNGVRLPTDPDSGEMKGYGYIEFSSVEEATAAYNALNGADIGGRNIRLDYAGARPDRGDGGGRGGRGRGGFGGGRGRGRGGFGDRGGRGGRGGARGGRGNFSSTNRGGFGDFKGKKMTF